MGKVLITGGTGFIGQVLSRALLMAGHEVLVLTRGEPGHIRRQGELTLVGWDGRTGRGWADLASGAWAVVNLAGAGVADKRWTARRRDVIRNSRVQASMAVMEAIRQVEVLPRVLVQGSAVGYYGLDAEECDESGGPGKGFLAETARDWEDSTSEAESLGVRRVVVRTGVVLGRNGGALAKMLTPFRLGLGGPLGSGRQPFPWIHMDDQVGGMLHLMERDDLSGPFNLTAPEPPDQKVFARALGKALKRPAFLPAPGFALRILLGDMATEMLLSGQRARPDGLLASGYDFLHPDLDKALQDILSDGRE